MPRPYDEGSLPEMEAKGAVPISGYVVLNRPSPKSREPGATHQTVKPAFVTELEPDSRCAAKNPLVR